MYFLKTNNSGTKPAFVEKGEKVSERFTKCINKMGLKNTTIYIKYDRLNIADAWKIFIYNNE